MKKYLTVLCVLFVALVGMTLVSCSDDDDVEPQVVSFSCEPNDALLAIANLTISYTDANGDMKTEALTGPFSKRITIKKFPAEGAFKVRATLKEYTGAGTSPKLTYSYSHSIFTESNSIMKMMIQSQSEIDDLISKINQTSWDWSFTSDGTSMK